MVTDLYHVADHLVSLEIAHPRRHLELFCNVVCLVEKKLVVILGKITDRCVFEDVFDCRFEVSFGKSGRGERGRGERNRERWGRRRRKMRERE